MESLSRDARQLLQLTKGSHTPPPQAKARLRSEIETKLAATTVVGIAGFFTKMAWATAALPLGKSVFLTMVLAGAATVGYIFTPTLIRHDKTPASIQPKIVAREAHEYKLDGPPPRRSLNTKPGEPFFELIAANASSSRPSHAIAPPNPVPTTSSEPLAAELIEETRLIRDAHRALLKNDPSQAIDLLSEHERRFPSGTLSHERVAASIVTFCHLGQFDKAKALWSQFEMNWPGSPLSERVYSTCHGFERK